MSEQRRSPEDFLAAPYSRVLIPDSETGTFTARILEFPGCIAQGDSLDEALTNLENAARSWLVAALDRGFSVPPPLEEQSFSGRVLVRLPRSIHQRAVEQAGQDGVSLNQFILSAVSERLGAAAAYSAFRFTQLADR